MNKVVKQSNNIYEEKIKQLKKIYPALFSDEGNLNEEELRSFLTKFTSTYEGKYEFNWAGKISAKRNAFTTSRAMLKPDKERSVYFDKTENVIIEGDNLEVLKLLQKSYQGKIKCIYIDPPYNTGNDFIYTDNFSEDKKAYWEKSGTTQDGIKLDTNTESQGRYHSNWLNMMYPRLLLARNLLTEDGAIFVSIDDNEVHNLRKIMDEVFGEENFIGDIVVAKGTTTGQDAKKIGSSVDRLLVYAINIDHFELVGLPLSEKDIQRFNLKDEKGYYSLLQFRKTGSNDRRNDRPNLFYSIKDPDGTELYPIGPGGYESTWRTSKKSYRKWVKEGLIEWKNNNGWKPYVKYYLEGRTKQVPNLWNDIEGNKKASLTLKEIFSSKVFNFPKPLSLIKRCIQIINSNRNDIILDFFAGSGTTAQAVMELNKEDGGNRNFILVQIPEKTDSSSEAYKAGYKKISDICIERVKRVSKRLTEEKVKGDLGFKVFTLSQSSFPENLFAPDPDQSEEDNRKAFSKYIKNVSTQLKFKFDESDLMYEVLLKDGFTLNFKIEKLNEFSKNNIFKVTDGEKRALLNLDSNINDETLQKLQDCKEERFICLERALDTTKKWNLKNIFGSNLWVI